MGLSRILSKCIVVIILSACGTGEPGKSTPVEEKETQFHVRQSADAFGIFRKGDTLALVTQNMKPGFRPYIHPIMAPDSRVELTEYSPEHHLHQTGLYWGFTRVNGTGATPEEIEKWFYNPDKPEDIRQKLGRDFFHNPGLGYWQKDTAEVLIRQGKEVKWQTVYSLLDASKSPILRETQTWIFTEKDGKFFMNLEWDGEALIDITVNEFDYGGLFLRMPWKTGSKAAIVNAARQKNEKANGQRAMWIDAGMEIEGLDEWGHIAIFDHPGNKGYPQPWRVDSQFGTGPVLAKLGDWKIRKGETITFRHQIVAYTGDLDEVKMNDLWGDYVGDKGMYNTASLWDIARQEGRDAKLLSPDEAVTAMTIKEGYKVNAFASEPMITQPMAFCWDDKGRLWIAENRDYESRGHGFSNSGDSRISILEDSDHDGVADTKKVFWEGIAFPSAIAVGHGGVFVGAPPNLLFVPDSNGDDIAETADIKVLLTGWGIRDRHETINSFHWGPDGWLYGLEGFATPSVIRKPKGTGRLYKKGEAFPEDLLEAEGTQINGGVWRYHPLKERFEVVAHGFSNPWGIDYDSKGQLFISACVIPHMFHVMQGGIYHRQGGQHFNPYVYEDLQTIVDHRHRSAHGGARIYQSDAFPQEEQGRLFMANIHEHAVLSDIIKVRGSGFTASHGDDFMMANNAQWVGFSMEIGPEGGLYVLDWHDADICGEAVLNKDTGRIFRIMPEKSEAEIWPGRFDDLNGKSDTELAKLQLSKSNWHAQRARVILQYRASEKKLQPEAVSFLKDQLYHGKKEDIRLRALWTLQTTNNQNEESLMALFGDRDEYIRAWAIQFLVEDGQPSAKGLQELTALSKKETSPVVRRYLAGALQRIEKDDRWNIAAALVHHKEDVDDPNIPLMLWYGIEATIAGDPEKALELAKRSVIPSLTQKIARRLVDGGQAEVLLAAINEKSGIRQELLKGMQSGVESNLELEEPDNWATVYKNLKADPELLTLADEIAQHFGDAEVANKLIADLKDESSSPEIKKDAIRKLALHQREELKTILPELLEIKDLRQESIRAVAAYASEELGTLLFQQYPNFTRDEKQEVILTLATRPLYGRLLANGIAAGTIPKSDIPAHVVLQLRAILGNGFVEIWGPIDDISQTLQTTYRYYQDLLTAEAIAGANPHNGKTIFERTCAACHMLYGTGGNIAPDLTGSNRTNTAYLLSNILNPSGDVQDDYKLVVITTRDGRTYSGNVISETDRNLSLRIVGQDVVNISKSQIQSRDMSGKSMMPEGLLNNLEDQEVLDLFAYLKELEPAPGK